MAETTEQTTTEGGTATKVARTEENIKTTLKQVDDPEIGVNIVDLGLIYEVNLKENEEVQVVMTLTTPFCPVGPSIKQQVANVIKKDVEGVEKVDVQFTFNPPWDKEMMSDDAKDELGIF